MKNAGERKKLGSAAFTLGKFREHPDSVWKLKSTWWELTCPSAVMWLTRTHLRLQVE